MIKTLRRALLAGLLLVPFAATSAFAQTPEGTEIKNTATVRWTDANANKYDSVTASVSVMVGFAPGVDVQSPATATPASPSTGNPLVFTIVNTGNGTDTVSVATTTAAGITITGYGYKGQTYATLLLLNAALKADSVAGAGNAAGTPNSIQVTVIYTVAPGQGGVTIPVTLTSTSVRSTGTSDSSKTDVTPTVSTGVNVTPDGEAVPRLPSNGTQYSQEFTVQNTGNTPVTYNLSASAGSGGVLSVVSVGGAAGTSGTVTVGPGGSSTVTVIYTVADVAAGSQATLGLSATHPTASGTTDSGSAIITVVRAAIELTKEAYTDGGVLIGGPASQDRVLPGQFIRYKITVRNAGGSAATLTGGSYGIEDPLPSQVTFDSFIPDTDGWNLSHTAGVVRGTLDGTLAASASRHFWIRVQVK